jgi:hypothetical protein
MTNRVGISINCHCATKWLNLNNRGCLTHGYSSANWRITLSGRWKKIFQDLEYFFI